MVLDAAGLFWTVVVSSCLSCELILQVLLSFRCCNMAMALIDESSHFSIVNAAFA